MPLQVTRRYITHPITIDGEPVDLRITRLDLATFGEFSRNFNRMGENANRAPLPQDATEAEREARAKLEALEEEEAQALMVESIRAWVTIAPGQVVDETGAEVTSGEDILALWGTNTEVMRQMLAGIMLAHKVGKRLGKALGSRLASSGSSDAPPNLPDGASLDEVDAVRVGLEDGTATETVQE